MQDVVDTKSLQGFERTAIRWSISSFLKINVGVMLGATESHCHSCSTSPDGFPLNAPPSMVEV